MSRPAVVLASASPRRRELLRLVGIEHTVIPADIDETYPPGEAAAVYAERLAREKAGAIDRDDAVVIGSDTIVVVDGDVLGKPRDREQAVEMLRRLSGRAHVVMTGVAVAWRGRMSSGVEEVGVTFRALSDDEIRRYVETGEPMDKAGAYGIQGFGATIVDRVDGDYFAVMGLPLDRLVRLCRALGLGYDFGPLTAGAIRRAPPIDEREHVAHADALHAVEAVLHADRVVLAWIAIGVDDQLVKAPVGAGALGIRVADESDHRPVERDRHVQRTGVRRKHQRRRRRECRRGCEVRCRAPTPAAPRAARDDLLSGKLARRASADEDRLQTEIVRRARPPTSAQRSGSQSFCGLLVATTIDAAGRSNGAKNVRCHARSSATARGSTSTGAVRHAERREELEVLILHVLRRVRRNLVRREQPVQSRARARSNPSLTGARVKVVTMPALK